MTPLSFAQYRIWLSQRLADPVAIYNVPVVLRLTGDLDHEALAAALSDVVARHEILRTVYPETPDGPRQRVLPAVEAHVPFVVARCEASAVDAAAMRIASEPFDLACQLPLRAHLFATAPAEHVLLLVLHHIAFDGWSLPPFLKDLDHAYAARRAGREPSLPDLPVQYRDYADWHRELLGEPNDPVSLGARQAAFWRTTLAGIPAELSLPTDAARPRLPDFAGGAAPLHLDADTHRRLADLAVAEQVTMFMVLHAAVAVLLTRLGAGTDIPIGTPVAGRADPLLADLVGCFNNLVVLRTRTEGNPTFRQVLRQVRETDLAALSHQDLPFERVVAALNPERVASRHPLFQVMLVAEAQVSNEEIALDGLEVCQGKPIDIGTAKVDLTFGFAQSFSPDRAPAGIEGLVEYARALFTPQTGIALAARLSRLLVVVSTDPDRRLTEIDLFEPTERHRQLYEWNTTVQQGEAGPVTAGELFETQACRTPDRVAVECAGTRLTYAQLRERADRLAQRLCALGAGPERVVGVCLTHSEHLAVALLGVLRAGAAFLPLDPEHPTGRIAFMLRDSGASILLTDRDTAVALPADRAVVCRIDDPPPAVTTGGRAAEAMEPGQAYRGSSGTAAYVIYTSGSTGVPKGVLVENRSLVNYLSWAKASYPGLSGTVQYHSSVAFDMSITSLLGPLVSGGTVRFMALEPDAGAAGRSNLIKVTPSHLRLLATFPDSWLGPDEMVVGGEAFPAHEAERLRRRYPCIVLTNEYGPTEATVGCTAFRVDPVERQATGAATVPIGRPIHNARVYVLDEHMNPVPTGVPGELYVAGTVLARGYLGRPGLTAEKFLPCPFGSPGDRMYRTQDLVRWRVDGQLEYLGRIDRQLKVRGFRVEPAEVEAVLRQHPAVAGVAVVARPDSRGEQHLVAYVVPDPDASVDDGFTALRSFAAERLPRPMVPSGFVTLDELPRALSGKLDEDALPPWRFAPSLRSRTAPVSAEERLVCELFADVLEMPEVGFEDSFFDMGGTSIEAAQVLARLAERTGRRIPLRVMYACPTVAQLASRLGQAWADGVPVGGDHTKLPPLLLDAVPTRSRRARKAVLLSGATGFFGAFLLHEILEGRYGHVYCLLRAPNADTAYRRLAANLGAFGRARTDLADRVTVVLGDLREPRLGLDDAEFARLSTAVDVIYHSGANVDALRSHDDLEPVNVGGTRSLIELAGSGVLSELHYVSSTSAATVGRYPANFHTGYAISKWRAERILMQARRLGVPAAVYRLPRLAVDSRTCRWNDRDIMARVLRDSVAVGALPDHNLDEPWVAADEAARLLIGTAERNPDGGFYEMSASRTMTMPRLARLAEAAGHPVALVSTAEWLRRLDAYDSREHSVVRSFVDDQSGEAVSSRGTSDGYQKLTVDLDERAVVGYLRTLTPAQPLPPGRH